MFFESKKELIIFIHSLLDINIMTSIIELTKERDLWKNRAITLRNKLSPLKLPMMINSKWKNKKTQLEATIIWSSVLNSEDTFDLLYKDGRHQYALTRSNLENQWVQTYDLSKDSIGYGYGC